MNNCIFEIKLYLRETRKQIAWLLSNWNKYDFILFQNKRKNFDIFYKCILSNTNIVLLKNTSI